MILFFPVSSGSRYCTLVKTLLAGEVIRESCVETKEHTPSARSPTEPDWAQPFGILETCSSCTVYWYSCDRRLFGDCSLIGACQYYASAKCFVLATANVDYGRLAHLTLVGLRGTLSATPLNCYDVQILNCFQWCHWFLTCLAVPGPHI